MNEYHVISRMSNRNKLRVIPGVDSPEVLGDLLLYGRGLELAVSMLNLSIISFFSLVDAVKGLNTAVLAGA